MDQDNGELLKRLLATFKVEAREHVTAMASGLVELEKASGEADRNRILEGVFREAHSFKGAARAVNAGTIESLCQAMEDVFSALQKRGLELSRPLFDLLHEAVDLAGRLCDLPDFQSGPEKGMASAMSRRLTEAAAKARMKVPAGEASIPESVTPIPVPAFPVGESKGAMDDMVRISTAKLDSLLYQAEELFPIKLSADQLALELREFQVEAASWKKAWLRANQELRGLKAAARNGRSAAERRRDASLDRLQEYLAWNQMFMESVESRFRSLRRSSERNRHALRGTTDNLLTEVKKTLMLPFSIMLEGFPKIVRDLSRAQGKEITLTISGAEIEIDKRILHEIKDALIHLVRNCIDHGVESAKVRLEKGKRASGTIVIDVSQMHSSTVEITVSDDGSGIDAQSVRAAAVAQGLMSGKEAAALPDQEVYRLLFRSGISTSPAITDVSGRGLGLAIVRDKMEKLDGSVSIGIPAGGGTSIRMKLPVTVTTFRGLVVKDCNRMFALPSSSVWKAARAMETDIKMMENRESLIFGGEALALVRLGGILGLASPAVDAPGASPKPFNVAILNADGKRIAFRMDEIIGEQELMAKSLGAQLSRVRNTGGAAVLASGQVIPVLNVHDLIRSAVSFAREAPAPKARDEARPLKSILVVEDSITSRTLIKNILESAGYRVETAVDGIDALAKLGAGKFDAVVTDVDMPRLNGFDLTSKIRSDKRISNLPVVLITSLDSKQDHERGFAVGAQAYIVKSGFDQGGLIGILARLV